MATKFLQEIEKQEVAIYVAVFGIIFAALIYFLGVDFDFKRPEVALEEKKNLLEIRTTLEQTDERHDFARFRSFTPIPPFEGVPGRPNPFHLDGFGVIDPLPEAEAGNEEIVETPEGAIEGERVIAD